MNVCILTPPFDILKSGYGTKAKAKFGYWPPLGPGFLSAAIKTVPGVNVSFIDGAAERMNSSVMVVDGRVYDADVVMISVLTANKDGAYELVRELRENYADKKIIMGGPHVTCFPEETMNDLPELDAVGIGEGEGTVAEVVSCFIGNKSLDGVKGIIYRENGNVIVNPPRDPVMDIDSLQSVDWSIYDFKLYEPLPLQYKAKPIVPFITSRGCPWRRCTFCYESKMGTQYRRHSPERVVKDIKTLVDKYGVKEVAFWDDNFMINEKWVIKFCDLLREEGIKIHWQAYGRVNTVTQPMLTASKSTGCWNIFFGFESGNQETLNRIKKGATLDQARKAAKMTHDLKMDTRGSFMVALPGETPEMAMNTVRFAIELNITFAQFLPVYPEPGTELYNDALACGKISKVVDYKGRSKASYVPDGYFDASEVERIVRLAYKKFYFRPKYIFKHIVRIRSMGAIKQYFNAFRFIKGITG